jgi:hypothetical protein
MPVDTRINVPFIPQEGITSQILNAMQLANEHHQQQQQMALQQGQLQLQQNAQPSQIAETQAKTGQDQAETQAIPQRLDLQKQEIDATNEWRKATIDAESKYRMGMLDLSNNRESRLAQEGAAKIELDKFNSLWSSKLKSAQIQGTMGNLKLRQEAIQNQKDFQDQEVSLRQQANQLRAQGLVNQAEQVESRADDISNHVGVLRNIMGSLDLAPETQIPSAVTSHKAPAQNGPGAVTHQYIPGKGLVPVGQ